MTLQTFNFGAPALTNLNDATQYTLAVEFTCSSSLPCVGCEWRVPDTAPGGTCRVSLWRVSDQTRVASHSFTVGVGDPGNLVQYLFDTPFTIDASTAYRASVMTPDRYVATTNYTWPHTDGTLTAGATNGHLHAGGDVYPDVASGNSANFHISPIVDTASQVAAEGHGSAGVTGAGEGRKMAVGFAALALGVILRGSSTVGLPQAPAATYRRPATQGYRRPDTLVYKRT